jgi:WD40 repeat protein
MNRFLLAAVGTACLAVAACNQKPTAPVNGEKNPTPTGPDSRDIGQQLYDAPFRPAKTGDRPAEPITLPQAQALVLDKVELSAKVDGTIWWIGLETTQAEASAAGIDKIDLYTHPRTKKLYRRLKLGDNVARGQVLVLMDDSRANADFETARIASNVAKKEFRAAQETVQKLKEIERKTRDGYNRNVVPDVEMLQAEARTIQYEGEAVKADGAVQKAAGEEAKAQLILDMHSLSAIEGKVQQILKTQGEGVKAQEPILTVQRLDRMKAVGNLPQELKYLVSPGDEVTIEAPFDIPADLGKTFYQHTTNKPITAVAVGVANGKPVIVSAGEDGEVLVWDRDLMKILGTWSQSAGVRALAVTRPGDGPALAVVGSDNGIASLYNLADPKADRVREFDGRHDGGVVAAAFSPDGKYCVTADEKSLYLYEVATGKRKYSFGSREHNSSITGVSFTPQGRVVSVGRDPSVLVWIVGEKDARVDRRFSRVGEVATLGVTDDGSQLLLDAAKTQLDVIHLQEGRKERPLIGAGEAGRFSTFAIWSPELAKGEDRRLIATTGGTEGVVQVWQAPTEQDRGIEIARLNTRDLSAATCAAFAPTAENGFLVVGTRKGNIHVWSRPDIPAKPKATVQNVGSAIDSSGRTVEMLVEFTNPKVNETSYLFRPGSSVTLVVRPKK